MTSADATAGSHATPSDPARFDELWDYDDPAATEPRFRDVLARVAAAKDETLRLQLETQIARTMSLRRRTEEARALFLDAWAIARACGEDGFAVDAAHMVAIVESGDESVRWNEIGLSLADTSADPRARRWRASLLNNLGWTYHGRGDFARAHEQFEGALAARLAEGTPQQRDVARWCVARCLRSLGRVEEALSRQRELLREQELAGRTRDGFVCEEIAECLLALGRDDEARLWFERAWRALSKLEWLAASEPARLERLRGLGSSGGPSARAPHPL